MWRYFVFLGYVGKWMFASYYLEAMTRPVSVCVWGGGASDRPCLDHSSPEVLFVNHTLFHSLLIHRYKNLHASGYINLYQSCLLLIFFWAQHILTFTEKNLCQIIWFAPFFKFYKPPLCGGILNLIVLNTYLSFPSLFLLNSNKHMPRQRWEREAQNPSL